MTGSLSKLLPGSKGKDGSTPQSLVKIMGLIFGARVAEQCKNEETSAAPRRGHWAPMVNSLPMSSSTRTTGALESKDESVDIIKELGSKLPAQDPITPLFYAGSVPPSVVGIADLPNELLIEIFTYVHARIFRPPSPQALRLWFHVLHTCVLWRSILLSVPNFWGVIPADQRLSSLSFFLTHRRTIPIELYLDVNEDAPNLAVLMPHIRSIRLLDISIRRLSIQHPSLDSLLLSEELNALEELRICPRRSENLWGLERAIECFTMPQLRRLYLRAFRGPLNLSYFPNLRALKLDSCNGWSWSFDHLIDTLEVCTSLEELYLNESLLARSEGYYHAASQYNARTLTLPHLCALHIFDPTAVSISRFLANLVAPGLTRLHVNHYCVKTTSVWRGDGNATPSLQALIQASDSTSRVLPNFTTDPATASISLSSHLYTVSLRSKSRSLSLSLTDRSSVLEWGAALPTAMRDLMELFPAAPITRFSITVRESNSSSTLWARIFGHMPLLEELELKGSGSSCEVWGGLYDASRRDPAGACCVGLRRVVIHGLPLENKDTVVSCFAELALARATLAGREAAGVKLEELVWKMYRPSKDEGEEEVAAYLAKHIEPLVGRLAHTDMGCPAGSEMDGAYSSLKIRVSTPSRTCFLKPSQFLCSIP
ncbi:hypothetical protein C8Q79DRAFT_978614 [Trametes meyenii]|nr:hypothetical protein C8Q79DRAFT_978614 [Trametes meyenii]